MNRRSFALVAALLVLAVVPLSARAVDFPAGAIEGSILWNGSVVTGFAASTVRVYIPEIGPRDVGGDGHYTYPAAPPGTYTVTAYAPACSGHPPNLVGTATVQVTANATAVTDFDLTSTAGRLIGRITVNGTALPHPNIQFTNACGSAASSSDGSFVTLAKPGTYTADVYGPSGRLGSFTFTIVAGQTTDVDFGTTPPGSNIGVELSGGLDTPGGLGVTFSTVTTGGTTVVVESGAGPPPPTGYRIVGLGGQPRYWDIDTSAGYTGPIRVCIRYDISQVRGPESQLRLVHDEGQGFRDITTEIDTTNDIICGTTTSLSPFAVVELEDAIPPQLQLPSTITAEATSAAGSTVTYAVTATDANPPRPAITCSPTSGATFPVGTTPVTCEATDAAGNRAMGTFAVAVVDTTGPRVSVPGNITAGPTGISGAAVSYSGELASDAVDGSVPVSCTPASGSTFPFGTTTVLCTSRDSRGNTGSGTFTVTVAPLTFVGFSSPVDNAPAVNTVKNGATVPVKWKLEASGLEITSTGAVAAGWPKQTQVNCAGLGGVDDEIETLASGESSLRFDTTERQFVYNWKTPSQAGTCWRLDLKLTDGTTQFAFFKLR